MKARRFLNVLTGKYGGGLLSRIGHSFEAFIYGDPNPPSPSRFMDKWYQESIQRNKCVWHWRELPPPPIVVDEANNYRPWTDQFSYRSWTVRSGPQRATSGPKSPLVPSRPGDGLLFGFENTYFHIHSCFSVVDVSSAMRMDGATPALRHAWVEINTPSGCLEQDRGMVYLGDGKFCIHRSFDIMETDGWGSGSECVDTVDLLTGMEVVREGSRLRMVKHKSKRLDTHIHSIL
ncbi:hypothetical protein VPH35_114144 [Triticum aestivum]